MKDKYIELFQKNIQRDGADDLLAYLLSSDFFDAPASTRFHLSQPGGLCLHSIHVYERLRKLCQDEALRSGSDFNMPSHETIAIVGLLHDLCKVGVYHLEPKNQKTYDPQKVAAAQKYQVKHDGMGDFIWETVNGYKFDDPIPYGHGEKSVYIISSFMKLSQEEAFAIRSHMGAWQHGEESNAAAAFDKFPLALLAHLADAMATNLDEGGRK